VNESVDPQTNQKLEAIKRAIANSLASVAVGRGMLRAATTVRAHVRARITLTELEQRAAYILRMGNFAAGQLLTPKPERRSNERRFYPDELPSLKDPGEPGPFIETMVGGTMPTAMERGGEL
jgi:hypothetical protein